MPFQNHFPWLLPVTRGSNNSPVRLHAAYIVRRARLTMIVIKAQSVFPFRRSFWPDVYCPACLLSERTKRNACSNTIPLSIVSLSLLINFRLKFSRPRIFWYSTRPNFLLPGWEIGKENGDDYVLRLIVKIFLEISYGGKNVDKIFIEGGGEWNEV